MKGVIFNILEQAVIEHLGTGVWDDLLDATGLEGAYTSLGSYPDSEIMALVGAAASAQGKTPAEILRWFGTAAIPVLAAKYPVFFVGQSDARNFLLSVNGIIHPEVRKLYSGAGCPHFRFSEQSGELIIRYNSPRKLCALAHGFIDGSAAYYREAVTVDHRSCMHDGADECALAVQWVS
ncbi:heme NO-binding domain-containing protein [Sphingomonas sp.]|jgi:hypothetical protein|uniref:heme NO-binding domain-containing protein n=1 Tax=Sphingomonas sp. TaxID=28214 RepID=UPI003BA8F76C